MIAELQRPDITELKPRITVFGVGGGGGNAVNNMINAGLQGVDFVVANTDAQALSMSRAPKLIQLGAAVTQGLGAGAMPEMGRAAAEECEEEIIAHLSNYHMVFITAGMGGGTGTGAAPVIAKAAKEKGILTVGVVTKPFDFEGLRRMKTAEDGIKELQECVDTLIVIPNQNLFRIANEKTTFAEAFSMADQVLYSGVASITDLMVKEGLINLDFADVRSVMTNMGRAMMGTGEASGEGRALKAAEAAIANPLLDESSMHGARGLLISITGGHDMTLFEVDEAANRIRQEVDAEADVIFGAIDDQSLDGTLRVSVVATGITNNMDRRHSPYGGTPDKTIRSNSGNNAVPIAPDEAPKPSFNMANSVQTQAAVRNIFVKPAQPTVPQQATPNGVIDVMSAIEDEAPVASNIKTAIANLEAEDLFEPATFEESAHTLAEVELKLQNIAKPEINMPQLDDFSPMVRHSFENAKLGVQPPSQPRSLWQRITQRFKAKAENYPTAKLEPAVPVAMSQEYPSVASSIKQSSINNHAAYIKTQQAMVDEVDELEIPAFLRRRAN
ncbi:MAG: cell division protein FtsZ [Alphaproteobacteria bacterium]|nr:cell division protein FtsZ [Alphaproteobacteria bacterium]